MDRSIFFDERQLCKDSEKITTINENVFFSFKIDFI